MRAAQKLKEVTESFQNNDLLKVVNDLKSLTFKISKDEDALLLAAESAEFDDVNVSSSYLKDDKGLDDKIGKSLDGYFKINGFKNWLQSLVDDESDFTEAAKLYISKLKNQDLDFKANVDVNFYSDKEDSHKGDAEYSVSCVFHITNADYNEAKDSLEISGKVKSVNTVEENI